MRASRSGLSREFAFKYPSHRVIAGLTLATGSLAGLLTLLAGDSFLAAVLSGLNTGAVAFVAWVLARELDPPRPWTAWLAALLAAAAAMAYGPLPLLASALFIFLLRIVNRAAGRRIVRVDRWVVLAATIVVLLFTGNGWLGLAAALAFLLDAAFTDRAENLSFAALAFSAGLIAWWQTAWPAVQLPDQPQSMIVALTLSLALIWLWRLPRRDLGPDDRGGDFDHRRLVATLALALVTCLLAACTSPDGWLGFVPLWAALLASLIPG